MNNRNIFYFSFFVSHHAIWSSRKLFNFQECENRAHHLTREVARSRCPNCSDCKYNFPNLPASLCGSGDCWLCRDRSSSSGCRSCSIGSPERDHPRGTRKRRKGLRGTAWSHIVSQLYFRSSRTCRGRLWSRSLALENHS